MGRINLTTILTWLTLSVALIIAFVFGWYQWGRLSAARREKDQTSRNIAIQERNKQALNQQFKNVTGRMATPDTMREDPEFYGQLKRLMETSNVRPVSIMPALPAALPTIGEQQAAQRVTVNASSNPPPKKPEEKKVGYSLTNLPLGVRPLSTTLIVVGSYPNITTFVRNLYNYRFTGGGLRDAPPRAININSLQINAPDTTTGELHATMLLTRFVRKPDAAPAPPQVK